MTIRHASSLHILRSHCEKRRNRNSPAWNWRMKTKAPELLDRRVFTTLQLRKSPASGPGTTLDLFKFTTDRNPIIYTGCPRSVCGVEYALIQCHAHHIPFEIERLECEPLCHGYVMECSEYSISIGFWKLRLVDMRGTLFVTFLTCDI